MQRDLRAIALPTLAHGALESCLKSSLETLVGSCDRPLRWARRCSERDVAVRGILIGKIRKQIVDGAGPAQLSLFHQLRDHHAGHGLGVGAEVKRVVHAGGRGTRRICEPQRHRAPSRDRPVTIAAPNAGRLCLRRMGSSRDGKIFVAGRESLARRPGVGPAHQRGRVRRRCATQPPRAQRTKPRALALSVSSSEKRHP